MPISAYVQEKSRRSYRRIFKLAALQFVLFATFADFGWTSLPVLSSSLHLQGYVVEIWLVVEWSFSSKFLFRKCSRLKIYRSRTHFCVDKSWIDSSDVLDAAFAEVRGVVSFWNYFRSSVFTLVLEICFSTHQRWSWLEFCFAGFLSKNPDPT